MATLAQIKSQLGLTELSLSYATDLEGNKTDWLRHWDNDKRVAISIHSDLAKSLKANPSENQLSLQSEMRTGEQGPYTAYRIVKYNSTPDLVL